MLQVTDETSAKTMESENVETLSGGYTSIPPPPVKPVTPVVDDEEYTLKYCYILRSLPESVKYESIISALRSLFKPLKLEQVVQALLFDTQQVHPKGVRALEIRFYHPKYKQKIIQEGITINEKPYGSKDVKAYVPNLPLYLVKEDVLILAQHFGMEICQAYQRKLPGHPTTFTKGWNLCLFPSSKRPRYLIFEKSKYEVIYFDIKEKSTTTAADQLMRGSILPNPSSKLAVLTNKKKSKGT